MKIGFFITARLKSSRLKQKILLDLQGKAILDHVIERCKKVYGIDGIVLCTSTNPQDSILYDFALKHKIQFYPGSEEDVLQRLSDAAEYYGYDGFLSITADNPLHSFTIAQQIVDIYKQKQPDFIFTKGVPIGIAPYFLGAKALQVAVKMKKKANTEIWGPFVNRPDFFNIVNIQITNSPFKEEKRITCDYPEDYELMTAVFNELYKGYQVPIKKVLKFLESNHKLWSLIQNIEQKYPNMEEINAIKSVFDQNISSGKLFAKKHNILLHPKTTDIDVQF